MKNRLKKTSRAVSTVVVSALALAFCFGCPGKAPVKYEFAPPPSEWTPMRSHDGALLFKKKEPPMGIMVNTECDRYQTIDILPLSRSLFIGFKERNVVSRGEATVDGNPAIETVMDCKLEETPVRVKAYTFKADNCIYDIAYFAAPEDFDSGIAGFEDFVKSFTVGKHPGAR